MTPYVAFSKTKLSDESDTDGDSVGAGRILEGKLGAGVGLEETEFCGNFNENSGKKAVDGKR